jgi:hypothetical protein
MKNSGGVIALALALALTSCGGDDEGSLDGGTTGVETTASSTMTTSASTSNGSTGPSGCIAGQVDCECLSDACVGALHCVENLCKPGPQFDLPDDRSVLAGMRVPVTVEVTADEFSWEQVGGPAVEIEGVETMSLMVDIPGSAPAGDPVILRLHAVRNTIEDHRDIQIDIHEADFENFVPEATADELGTTEGLDFRNNDMWVVSTEGFVSRFAIVDGQGSFNTRHDVPGTPVGARFGQLDLGGDDPVDVLFLANAGSAIVQYMTLGSGDLTTITDALEDGSPLGAVNFVLPAPNGNLFFTNRADGQVLVHDIDEGVTRVFVEDLGMNPNALTFGPNAGYLYIGTAGRVYRVPVLPDGTAGDTTTYLELGPEDVITEEVDGLEFDEAGNLWIGAPNSSTLYLARYVADGPSEVANSWSDVGGGVSRFVNVRFGNNTFGREYLYYTNLGDMTVGRLYVGLRRS